MKVKDYDGPLESLKEIKVESVRKMFPIIGTITNLFEGNVLIEWENGDFSTIVFDKCDNEIIADRLD